MAGFMNGSGGTIDGVPDSRLEPPNPEDLEVRNHTYPFRHYLY